MKASELISSTAAPTKQGRTWTTPVITVARIPDVTLLGPTTASDDQFSFAS